MLICYLDEVIDDIVTTESSNMENEILNNSSSDTNHAPFQADSFVEKSANTLRSS